MKKFYDPKLISGILLLAMTIPLLAIFMPSDGTEPPQEESEDTRLQRISEEGHTTFLEVFPAMIYQMGPAIKIDVPTSDDPNSPLYNQQSYLADENKYVYLIIYKIGSGELMVGSWSGDKDIIDNLGGKMPTPTVSMEEAAANIAKSMGRGGDKRKFPEKLSGADKAYNHTELGGPQHNDKFRDLFEEKFVPSKTQRDLETISFLNSIMSEERGKITDLETLKGRKIDIQVKRFWDPGVNGPNAWLGLDKVTLPNGQIVLLDYGMSI